MRCGESMQRTARHGESMLVVLPKLTEYSLCICHAIFKKIVLARITTPTDILIRLLIFTLVSAWLPGLRPRPR